MTSVSIFTQFLLAFSLLKVRKFPAMTSYITKCAQLTRYWVSRNFAQPPFSAFLKCDFPILSPWHIGNLVHLGPNANFESISKENLRKLLLIFFAMPSVDCKCKMTIDKKWHLWTEPSSIGLLTITKLHQRQTIYCSKN